MEHKPFAVIAPIAVAAILILGIPSGISSTAAAQLSKLVKKPYVTRTVKSPNVSKSVKSPNVSKSVKSPNVSKSVKMGATKTVYRAQGASNSGNTQQECKPTITLEGAKNGNAAQEASTIANAAQGASNSGNTQQECKPTITLKGAKNENAAQGASNENAAEAAKNTNAAQGASNGKAIHIHIHTGS